MLTRDFLMNADCKTAFGAIEESLLWSAEQRAASLAATLACRPDDGSVWIFGYGSLIWNPALNYRESCTGTLPGWHRAFCLRLTAGRGSACQPGRMLALKEGGRTTGVAYRLPDDTLEEELTLLWKREMITGCYLPTWCKLELDDGRTVNALVLRSPLPATTRALSARHCGSPPSCVTPSRATISSGLCGRSRRSNCISCRRLLRSRLSDHCRLQWN